MLSRRHIRIKVLQALYEFGQDNGGEMAPGLRRLEKSIDRIYELFLYELKALLDVHKIAQDQVEQKKNRKLPSAEDLNPNLKFIDNKLLNWLSSNDSLSKGIENLKVSWGDDRDILKKIFKEFQDSDEFKMYMSSEERSIDEDKKIIKIFYGKHIVHSEILHQLYEDKEMHWADDLDAAQMMVAKTIKSFDDASTQASSLPSLLKDKSDLEFARVLYKECIKNNDKYAELIHAKTKNWEMDRIAFVDVLLMKMALAELTNFKEIPVKVTLNEYIEIGKEYSTPKSGNFINGILDKLKHELSESGEIKKIGRGLL